MISIYEKIEEKSKPIFSMPLSLRIIKELSANGIDCKYLHFADVLSLFYSLQIDKGIQYLEAKRHSDMKKRGIDSISKATENDFDNL